MDLLDEIDNVLKTQNKFTGREGIRRTAQELNRVFNRSKELSREAIEALEKELDIDIIGTLAGQQLSDTAPRSAATIGDTLGNVVRPAASMVGRNVIPAAGAGRQVYDAVVSIPGIPKTTRAALVNTIAELFRDEQNDLPDTQ